MNTLKVAAIGAEAVVVSTLAVSSYHVAFNGANGVADYLAGIPIITVVGLEALRIPISLNLVRARLLGGAISLALLGSISLITFEAANLAFTNLIYQRTRPVALAERDLVKAQHTRESLDGEAQRVADRIALLTADVKAAQEHRVAIDKPIAQSLPPPQMPVAPRSNPRCYRCPRR